MMTLWSFGIFLNLPWYVAMDLALFFSLICFQLRQNGFRGKVSKLVNDLAEPGPSPNANV
jgi:hypothetical protein